MASGYPHLQPEDVAAAQAVIDAWRIEATSEETGVFLTDASVLELRGIIAVQLSDVRDAGHIAGRLQGRREVARWVRDALEGEGL